MTGSGDFDVVTGVAAQATVQMPPSARVLGFEVTSYIVS